jgi:hypothetical protein
MTRTDHVFVAEPAGLDAFCDLASRLYGELGQDMGGPLHVELEDHNTELLVGEAAAATKAAMAEALVIIGSGQVPTESEGPRSLAEGGGWRPGSEGRNFAYWYAETPEVLHVAIAILSITEAWSEEQADAAYAEWRRRGDDSPCGCREWPAGFAKATS